MLPLPAAVPEPVPDAAPGLRVPAMRQVRPAELPEPGLTAELPEQGLTAELPEQVQRAEPQASESQAEPRERLSEPVLLLPVKPELLPAGPESLRVLLPVQTEPPSLPQLCLYRLLLLRLHRRHSMQKLPHL